MAICTWFTIWIISYDNAFSAIMCILTGAILFGGVFSLVYAIIKLVRKRPVLVVNDNGFLELLDLEAGGPIPWGYVQSCHLSQANGAATLAVYLKDYDFLLNRFQGYERMNMTRAIALHETCVFISCKELDMKPEDLYALFDERIYKI